MKIYREQETAMDVEVRTGSTHGSSNAKEQDGTALCAVSVLSS
jgi:hypothetical protein